MKNSGLIMAAFAVAIVTSACVPIQSDEVDISGSGDDPMARAEADKLSLPADSDKSRISLNKIECDKLAGKYIRQGLAGYYTCTLRYSDAGKTCTRETDCIGQCRIYNAQPDSTAKEGRCQPTTIPFGCYAKLDKNGKQTPTICVD